MGNLNHEFFDEFKLLDALCRDIFGAIDKKLGVTLYIEAMDAKKLMGCQAIDGWESDKRRLIEVRNKRNELAHSRDGFSVKLCTQADIDFVRSFRERILNQTDPLALFEQKAKARKTKPTPAKPQPEKAQPEKSQPEKAKTDSKQTKKLDTAITAWSAVGIIAFLFLAAWLISQFTS